MKRAPKIKFYEIINQLENYADRYSLTNKLRDDLFAIYHHRFHNSYYNETLILNSVSKPLRYEILLHCGRSFLEKMEIFENIPRSVLSRLVEHLKPEHYLPNDMIVNATTIDFMYFLVGGTVAAYTISGREIAHLEDGSYFGEIPVVMNQKKRSSNVIAIEICDVYRLAREDYVKCIQSNSVLAERFLTVAKARFAQINNVEEKNRSERGSN